MNSNNTDYILSSCKYFSEFEARSMGYESEKIIPAGLPRNDILFGDHEEIRNTARRKLSIPDGVKFVLFAPTFRSKSNEFSNMNIAENYIELEPNMLVTSLERKFKSKWVCGIRYTS